MAETPDFASMYRAGRTSTFIGPTIPTAPTGGGTAAFDVAVGELEVETAQLRAEVLARVNGGVLVRLDGKRPCTAGKWGNNYGATRETQLDPGWCSRSRDRNLPPILRLPVRCEDLDTLFWPDIYARCQAALSRAVANKPAPTERWEARASWTRHVMELASIALESTNIQPIFLFPAKWATEHPYKAQGGDGFLVDWGLPTSGFTSDGRHPDERWTANEQTLRRMGGCIPADVHAFFDAWSARTSLTLSGALGLVHFGSESLGYTAQNYIPAMLAGSLISDNSQTIMALRGNHDPWTSTGFPEQDPEELYPAKLPVLPVQTLLGMLPREQVMGAAPNMDAILQRELAFRGAPMANFMTALFGTAAGPAAFIRTLSPRFPVDAQGFRASVTPNAQFYVDLAEVWARVIVQRPMADLVSDSTLFWLINHHTYFKRVYGDAVKLTTEEVRALADAIAASRATLLRAGLGVGGQIVNLLSPIAGAIMGQVANMVTDAMVQYLSYPELPRPLFRRVSTNQGCDLSGGGAGGTEAAWRDIAAQQLAREAAGRRADGSRDDALMQLIASGRSSGSAGDKTLYYAAGAGLAAVGVAVLWKYLGK